MNEDSVSIFFWLFVAGVIFAIYWIGGVNVAWYSLRYGLSPENVHVDAKPTDCDFLTAPLGIKGCSYKTSVRALNLAGAWVAGDGAPKYGRDTKTGKPILSYDNGKSWNWLQEANIPDLKVDKVLVSWVKVKD